MLIPRPTTAGRHVHDRLSELAMRWLDLRGFRRIRREVCGDVRGRVLEIGAGSGSNLPHYGDGVTTLTLIEPNELRTERMHARAPRPADVELAVTSADRLPFPDDTFDEVVSTLVLCSVEDLPATLGEIRRVMRPGGVLRFAEHVRSDDPREADRQDRRSGLWRRCSGGCHPNRDTVRAIQDAGFTIRDLRRTNLRGAPRTVRPLAVGTAVAQGSSGG